MREKGSHREIMVRAPFYDKDGIKKGAWSLQEDDKLRACILKYGHPNWREIPKLAGMQQNKRIKLGNLRQKSMLINN